MHSGHHKAGASISGDANNIFSLAELLADARRCPTSICVNLLTSSTRTLPLILAECCRMSSPSGFHDPVCFLNVDSPD